MSSKVANICAQGVQDIVVKCVTESVYVLAAKHGFDFDEAIELIDIGNMATKVCGDVIEKKSKEKETKETKETKEPKKSKVVKEPKEKVKRSLTGYQLYTADVRPKVKKELEDALAEGEKIDYKLVLPKIGEKWKAEEQSVRDKWVAQAKEAKDALASDAKKD